MEIFTGSLMEVDEFEDGIARVRVAFGDHVPTGKFTQGDPVAVIPLGGDVYDALVALAESMD